MILAQLRSLERFLIPNACIVCGRGVGQHDPDGLVCAICRARVRPVPSGCLRCQQPLPPVGPCRFCRDWSGALEWVRSALWLENETRAIVHHLKYEHCPNLGALVGELVQANMPPPPRGWLIPIPTGPRRLRERGYDQTAVIARHLSRLWRLPVASNALTRSRHTGTQTALTPKARLANVAGAFDARPAPVSARPAPGSEARTAILVDDVLTTGATLDAAASALSSAGWPSVGAVTFARAMPFATRVVAGTR